MADKLRGTLADLGSIKGTLADGATITGRLYVPEIITPQKCGKNPQKCGKKRR